MSRKALTLFDPTLVKPAIVDSFKSWTPDCNGVTR